MIEAYKAVGQRSAERRAFAHFLRTGRILILSTQIQQKFNPWHDPKDGRFTNGPGGMSERIDPSEKVAHNSRPPRSRVKVSIPLDPPNPTYPTASPHHPSNYSIYIVKKGESLAKIAKMRKGLRVSDVSWLNGIDANKPIQPGQEIKLPHQAYLESGRAARANFYRLNYYMQLHGGALPPNPAKAPDILAPVNWRHASKNGYDFAVDAGGRTREVTGTITLNPNQLRNPKAQTSAGGADRRRGSDEGGHYIAREFNGPTEAFNHFAQDRNFNRSAYRTLENEWKKLTKSGQKVRVRIVPSYKGYSLRPSSIHVTYWFGGHKAVLPFPNERGER